MFCSGLGQYTAVLPIALLTSRRASSNAASPELARTKGRRFCVLQEPEDDVRINVGLMKELTGGDRIVSRELYGPILEFKPQFKMVLTCNKLPDIPSNDGGTWRRIRAVEFKSKFCENPDPQNPLEFPVDTSLSTRIDELGQGLVSILIEYYRRYVDEGLIEPAAITNYTMEYQKRCDVFLEFVQSYVIPTEDRRDIVRVSEVYGSFKEWYRQNEPDMSKLPNSKDLRDYVNTRMKRVCSHNMWRGLKLRAIGEEVFDSDSEAGDDDQVL
jgi:phage/plasmid-associated DNA primase